jgi:GT2 family glycosyltransferase
VYYYLVDETERGLTKQRNVGISKVNKNSEVVCFLDDDTILDPQYFEELINTYQSKPDAIGVGGYITNEVKWKTSTTNISSNKFFCMDGYYRNEGIRFRLRKFFKLIDHTPPGYMPMFSHGRSISFLPPTNKIYKVESFMGGVSSYKNAVFKKIQFSTYFEGYGLYEDMDFCLRLSKIGQLYVNTAATLEHHHESAGRPNKYNYGKMVVRNGWYVWHVKYPNPGLKARLKWNLNVIVLMKLRFINSITSSDKKATFTEALGRLVGWFSLIFNKPTIER